MKTLRYIGNGLATFDQRIGQVESGGTFGVPDDEVERYTRRADIELVKDVPDPSETSEAVPEVAEDGGEALTGSV